ncbi:hypothetical protein AMTRI_Chr06g196140 [Amborella trichopoda]
MNFYKCFPKAWGFSVLHQRTIRKEGDGNGTTKRFYVCDRAGHLTNKGHFEIKGERDRSSRRCNCRAQLGLEMLLYIRVFWALTCDWLGASISPSAQDDRAARVSGFRGDPRLLRSFSWEPRSKTRAGITN